MKKTDYFYIQLLINRDNGLSRKEQDLGNLNQGYNESSQSLVQMG